MAIDNKIREENYSAILTEKQQNYQHYHQIKNWWYEYFSGEEVLSLDQGRMIKQAKFTYSPLGKAFEKQIRTMEDQGKKQVEPLNTLKCNKQLTIEDLIPNDARNNDEAKKELDKTKEIEKKM